MRNTQTHTKSEESEKTHIIQDQDLSQLSFRLLRPCFLHMVVQSSYKETVQQNRITNAVSRRYKKNRRSQQRPRVSIKRYRATRMSRVSLGGSGTPDVWSAPREYENIDSDLYTHRFYIQLYTPYTRASVTALGAARLWSNKKHHLSYLVKL